MNKENHKPIKQIMYKCPDCYEAFDNEREADLCLFEHVKERCINHDFQKGFDLEYIKNTYSIFWKLDENQKKITKDNCFTISYLQCCDYPAYKIKHISAKGKFKVGGIGSWSGYYSSQVGLDCFKNPRPKEELFIYKRSRCM